MIKVLLILITSFNLYASTTLAPKENPKALFVFLHGCKMDGGSFAKLTGIAREVQTEKIVAFFPSQNVNMNSDHCWNWFLPVNQSRYLSMEHFSILNDIQRIQIQYGLSSAQTYLVGLSAGAAYAMNLISCFPERFNGAVIHSGLSYLAATDIFYANQALLNGPQYSAFATAKAAYACGAGQHQIKKTLIIHGKEDVRVKPLNFVESTKHFVSLFDLIDDGISNSSFPQSSATKTVMPPGRYTYDESSIKMKGGKEIIRTLFVDHLMHKWSGGMAGEIYADPMGPNVNRIMLDFFLK